MAEVKDGAQKKKTFDFNTPVKPTIAWGAYAGTLVVVIVLALIFWL